MYCQVVVPRFLTKKQNRRALKPSLTYSDIDYFLPVPISFLIVRFPHFTVLATL